MKEEGAQFKETGYSKEENLIFIKLGVILQENNEQIGEYFFHVGNLSLEYFTEETKRRIGY